MAVNSALALSLLKPTALGSFTFLSVTGPPTWTCDSHVWLRLRPVKAARQVWDTHRRTYFSWRIKSQIGLATNSYPRRRHGFDQLHSDQHFTGEPQPGRKQQQIF
mmetsp:Transcript_85521/g.153951  ORF Transcript_85521/g.153951 Transcript_85521/m.153951 type:complete len:105 (+) Transcript_85521:757-1071(+)